MSLTRFPGFVGPTYNLDSVAADCQRCVNLYLEADEAGTQPNNEKARLKSIPGNLPFITLASSTIRGMYTASTGELYVVGKDHLYWIHSTNTVIDCGTLNTTTGPVSMVDNGTQLMIVDGSYGYIYLLAGGTPLGKITDASFFPASKVAFLDGYFVVNRVGTAEFHFSDLYDGTVWDALDFATAEGSPDPLLDLQVVNRQIVLFGTKTIEIWYNSGAASLPFARVPGGLIEVGAASSYCAAKVANTLFWLDSGTNGQGVVWKLTGFVPKRVSTHAVESVIQQSNDLSGAYAWSYQDGGHSFYCLTIPYTHTTWVYDLATDKWHERQSVDGHNRVGSFRIGSHAFAYNRHYLGDASTGDIYLMDDTYYQDGINPLIRLRSSPHLNSGNNRLFVSKFSVDMEVGVGIDGAGQGSDPTIMMRWSDDRGHSWSDLRTASLGKLGAYTTRAIWRRLGCARDRVYEVSVSDPVSVTILGADIDVEKGVN